MKQRHEVVMKVGRGFGLEIDNASTYVKLTKVLNGLVRDANLLHTHTNTKSRSSDGVLANITMLLVTDAVSLYRLMANLHNFDPIAIGPEVFPSRAEQPVLKLCQSLLEDSHPMITAKESTGDKSSRLGGPRVCYTSLSYRDVKRNAAGEWDLKKPLKLYYKEYPDAFITSNMKGVFLTAGLPTLRAGGNYKALAINMELITKYLAFLVYIAALRSDEQVLGMLWLINHTFGVDERQATQKCAESWSKEFIPVKRLTVPQQDPLAALIPPEIAAKPDNDLPSVGWDAIDAAYLQWKSQVPEANAADQEKSE